jgi:lipopolysaccharide/colanic/teichoic acid biosynthesis glycosyltransferase
MCLDAEDRLEAYLDAHPDARAQWQRYCKLKDDPRVLPRVGHLLRRTSMDELPQLWNVIRGDMSLIGPRPFPPYHVNCFSPEFRRYRQTITPGLTGLWQVVARSNGDLTVQEVLDTFYIQNWSPWLDAYIILRTIWAVLFTRGAC